MFPGHGRWYLTLHDALVDVFDQGSIWGKPLQSGSWREHGMYSIGRLSPKMLSLLDEYRLA